MNFLLCYSITTNKLTNFATIFLWQIVTSFLSLSRGPIFFFFSPLANQNLPQGELRQKLCIFLRSWNFCFLFPIETTEEESKEFYENYYSRVYICISKPKTIIMH